MIAITLLAAAMAAAAQYLFKRHVKEFRVQLHGIMKLAGNRYVVGGLLIYFLGFLVYVYALSKAPSISFVYPVFTSSFIFVLLISHFALREKVGAVRIAGILLIVLGICIVALTYG